MDKGVVCRTMVGCHPRNVSLLSEGEGQVQKSDDDSNDCGWVSENSDGNGEQGSAHNE